MKNIFWLTAISIVFLWGCSTARYSFNKIKRSPIDVQKQSIAGNSISEDVPSFANNEESENNNSTPISFTASSEEKPEIIIKGSSFARQGTIEKTKSQVDEKSTSSSKIITKIIKKEAKKDGLGRGSLLWTVIGILLILWLLALLFGSGSLGALIHILLVVALVLIIYKLLT